MQYCLESVAILVLVFLAQLKLDMAFNIGQRLLRKPPGIHCNRPFRGPSNMWWANKLQFSSLEQVDRGGVSSSSDEIVDLTRKWVKAWVVKLRLCPWAAGVNNEQAMRVSVLKGDYYSVEGKTELLHKVLSECDKLLESISEGRPHKTSLLVMPSLSDFDDFLDFHEAVEGVLDDFKIDKLEAHVEKTEETSLSSYIQVATFHPDYVFADTDPDAVDNYTNRSPFPILHLLPTEEVSKAIASVNGNTDDVWLRNIQVMKNLEKEKLLSFHQKLRSKASEALAKSSSL